MTGESELRAWADDEFVVGHILASHITEYTHLEECLAIGSLAQDELAHARALYEYTGLQERDLDRYAFMRAANDFAVTPLVTYQPGDFAEVVIKQYLYELLDELRMEQAEVSGPDSLRALLAPMRYEERMHRDHWTHWMQVLADSSARSRLDAALAQISPYCGGVAGMAGGAGDDTLEAAWRARAERDLQRYGLTLGAPDGDIKATEQASFATLIDQMQSVFRERPEVRQG